MIARLLPLLLVPCLLGAAMLHAQDCYIKALEKGEKLYQKGNHDKAREAWEKGKECPGADVAKLDEKIRKIDDYDLDGILNMSDQCFYDIGPKETNGCPCGDVYRRWGIDSYYDNQPDSALMYFNLAKNCGDAKVLQDVSVWETKISEHRFAYDTTDQAGNEVFTVVDKMPEYIGGESSMLQFVNNRLRYLPYARENGVEGTVFIKFIIEKDGNLSHVRIFRDIGGGLGEEAARVVRMMPAWKPGMMGDKPVRVFFNFPARFRLQ